MDDRSGCTLEKRRTYALATAFICTFTISHLANAADILWSEANMGFAVRSANLNGSSPSVIAANGSSVRGLYYNPDNRQVYWTVYGTSKLFAANLDGSSSHAITPTGANPTSIAIDSGKIYWANYEGGSIEYCNVNGTGRKTLIGGLSGPLSLAIDAGHGHILWTEYANGAPKIREANLDGTGITSLVTSNVGYPAALALDLPDQQMFWADTGGYIKRADLNGTNQTTILFGLNVPSGLALDTSLKKMYFSEYYDATINSADFDGSNRTLLFTGVNNSGIDEVVLITPEPGTLLLLASIVAGSFFRFRRGCGRH